MTTAHPLSWPAGWPRTRHDQRDHGSKFQRRDYMTGARQSVSFDRARQQLLEELKRLGARDVVISTNVPLRQDGQPYAGAAGRRMDDPGVAVYFTLRKKPLAMARDSYHDIAANMRSLGLAIEGLRQLERHGGSYMMERAFDGFAALPAPESRGRPWHAVLGFTDDEILALGPGDVDAAFRRMAKDHHPDVGGAPEKMAELNAAREQALEHVQGAKPR